MNKQTNKLGLIDKRTNKNKNRHTEKWIMGRIGRRTNRETHINTGKRTELQADVKKKKANHKVQTYTLGLGTNCEEST